MKTFSLAEAHAKRIVNTWTVGAGILGWVPGSSIILTGADLKLVRDVAKAFGVDHYSVEEITVAIAACIAGRSASELLSGVPILGWLAKSAVAAGVTKAVGEITISYFKERSPYS